MGWKKIAGIGIIIGGLTVILGGIVNTHQNPFASSAVIARADTTNQASGTDGTCDWYLTQDGDLHIGPGTLAEPQDSQNFDSYGTQIGTTIAQVLNDTATPTNSMTFAAAALVKQVILDGKVVAPVNSGNLFAQLCNVDSFENLADLDTSKTTNMAYMFMNNITSTGTDILTECLNNYV